MRTLAAIVSMDESDVARYHDAAVEIFIDALGRYRQQQVRADVETRLLPFKALCRAQFSHLVRPSSGDAMEPSPLRTTSKSRP